MTTLLIVLLIFLSLQLNVLAAVFLYQKYYELKPVKDEVKDGKPLRMQDILGNL